ncbi:hypothetical protein ANN_20674 [Periplaneta americana]|uniref:Mariner Mos1 transposase n=1 Tax=Periplaneta americana TaxID=6978 RepID=A0ABQ8SEE3_PERAM|nr:hypothetical protein ANN_20674 [Periplaneta americana]
MTPQRITTSKKSRIVTVDGTWCKHYKPQSKRHGMKWKHDTSPRPKKFRNFTTAGNVMLMLFFDSEGPLLCHFKERGESVTSARYFEILRTELRHVKRPGCLREGVILLHANARPHRARHTMYAIRDLRWEVLEHPTYSKNLSPCDFQIFGKLKSDLGGRRFATDSDVIEAVHQCCHQQPKDFYEQGSKNLMSRWDKCLNTGGDYFEKQDSSAEKKKFSFSFDSPSYNIPRYQSSSCLEKGKFYNYLKSMLEKRGHVVTDTINTNLLQALCKVSDEVRKTIICFGNDLRILN